MGFEVKFLIVLVGAILAFVIQALVDVLFNASIYEIYLKIREKVQNGQKPKTSAVEQLKMAQDKTMVEIKVRVNCQLKPGKVFPMKAKFVRDRDNEWTLLNCYECFRSCCSTCYHCSTALFLMLNDDLELMAKEPITLYDLDTPDGYSNYIHNKYKAVLERSDSILCKAEAAGADTATHIRIMDEIVLEQLKKEEAARANENQ